MTSCNWTLRLSAYHDGELSPVDVIAVEEHLATCQMCQRELLQYRRLSQVIGRLEVPELPAGTLARMKRRIESEGNLLILRMARRMTGIAAAVFIAGSLWLVSANSSDTTPTPVHDWEAAAVSPAVDTGQQNTGDIQLAEWIETDLSRK